LAINFRLICGQIKI